MDNSNKIQDNWVFGLDIGTRNIVGVVGYLEKNNFKVVAMAAKEHETRAMLDGQIHDIYKVGETIRNVKNQLESQLGKELSEVCIAAAGRVLKTVNITKEYEFEEETRILQEHIYSLNLLAVEEAHSQINAGLSKEKFFCVGNTPVKYMLNDYEIKNLEGHKANKIGVELIATFLPEEVVDGLYEAVDFAGLQVVNLTLEPIAAINIAIPEQFRLLNIALIDVGAGTSDICITKDGSIVSYGMIPFAGDEITEVIAKKCLVDFNTAEVIKLSITNEDSIITYRDIMGLTQEVHAEEIIAEAEPIIDRMAKEAAEKIVEINGGKATSAVFVVGGGGKILGYTQKVAEYLNLPKERVAVRGEEVLTNVDFMVEDFKKDSLYVTPIGICTNYYSQKNNFVFVTVNNQRLKLYDNNKLTVVDAVMQIGFPNEKLFPRRGKELNFTINKKTRLVRGTSGEGAIVKLNGKLTNLNAEITQNDVIEITESTVGEPASFTIGQLEEHNSSIYFIVNDKKIICPRFAYVNGELKSEFYSIQENDVIQIENYYTVAQMFEFLDYDVSKSDVYINNVLGNLDTKVYENFSVRTAVIDEQKSYALPESYSDLTNETDYKDDFNEDFDKNYDNNLKSNNSEQKEGPCTNSNQKNISNNINTANTANTNTTTNSTIAATTDIIIMINNEPVKLTGKKEYVLVDLFQFYAFDLSKPRGNIVITLNGVDGDYTAPIKDGDAIQIYWA